VAAEVDRCFRRELPLNYAQSLLAEWEANWWTAGNLARLRVLLCDRAFEAGLEVRQLREAGRNAPALGDVLQVDDRHGVAQLRLLWSLRPRRPWGGWSEAVTAFEVAADPGAGQRLLGSYPDLLLMDPEEPAILLCGRGVVFQGALFTELPDPLGARARRGPWGGAYELRVGGHRFPITGDPDDLISRLEHWFNFYFGDFRPQVAGVYAWQAPEGMKPTEAQEAVACPECLRLLLPRLGEVGMLVEGAQAR
jgi:hypothetical protein